MRWRRYVAVGDSFTEGLDDPAPDTVGGYRGWADLVAIRLAALAARSHRATPAELTPAEFQYANLAVRGRLFHDIVETQVPVALAMRPDLVSFAGGGNDVLRRGFDATTLVRRFDEVVRSLRESGADVIVFRWAKVITLPGRRVIEPRMRILHHAVGEAVQRHGAIMVDLWRDEEFGNPRLWSTDRLHLSAAGHRRVAAHVLAALDVSADPSWLDSPMAPERPGRLVALARDARWVGVHLLPWLTRRLTGRSSGDGVAPKRPALTAVRVD